MNKDKYSLENIAVDPWWEIEDSKGNVSVKIPTLVFMQFLECLDFRTAVINGIKKVVRIQDNIVTIMDDNWDIIKIVLQWLKDNSEYGQIGEVYTNQVASAWINKTPQLFNHTNLGYIKGIEIKRHWDSADKSYLYFLNTAVKISNEGYQCIAYTDLDGHVFKEQIINREFKN